jgi:predicted Zn-dependent protease
MSVSLQKVAEQALKSAKKAGASEADAYVVTNRELTVSSATAAPSP